MERLPATLPVTGGVRRAIEAWRGDPAAWARWSEGRLESPDPWGMRVVLEVRSEENLVDLLDLLESEFPDSLPEWWVVNSRAGYLQVVVPYADLPIGIFTAIVGGPTFFIFVETRHGW